MQPVETHTWNSSQTIELQNVVFDVPMRPLKVSRLMPPWKWISTLIGHYSNRVEAVVFRIHEDLYQDPEVLDVMWLPRQGITWRLPRMLQWHTRPLWPE